MSIYENFPMQFVRWAMEHDVTLTLHKNYIDLNTGMKSDCHLYYEDGKYYAKMRYGEEKLIENFIDLYYAVRDCEHGRDFMSRSITYLYNNGFGVMDHVEFG